MTVPRKPRRTSAEDKSTWTEGERHWDAVAAANGVKPMPDDLSLLARVTPEEAEELLQAARQVRADDAEVGRRRRQRRRKSQAS